MKLHKFSIPCAIGVGIVAGLLNYPWLVSLSTILSTITVKTLQLISLPIIFFSILSTLTRIENLSKLKNVGLKVLKYTFWTTGAAATTALLLYLLIAPTTPMGDGHEKVLTSFNWVDTLLSIYPSNVIGAFSENNVMGVVWIGAILGIAITLLPQEQKEPLSKFFSAFFAAILKIAHFMIYLLPFGVFAFVALFVREVSEKGIVIYKPLMLYLAVVIGANLIQGLIILPIFLIGKGISPIKTFKGVMEAITVAFFTKSSNATLPITLKNVEENLQVPRSLSSFTLPICTTINMNGCAAFILTTVLFVSSSAGHLFSWWQMLGLIVIATLAAVGNAGVPMGCYFLSGALLSGFGVDLYLLGLILPAYAILDMIETALNVWSDCCITMVVNKETREQHAPILLEDG